MWLKQRQGCHGWVRSSGLLNPFSGSFNACLRQQLRAPAWDSGEKWDEVGLVLTASGASPKFESNEMHAAGSFCNRFLGEQKGNISLGAGIFPYVRGDPVAPGPDTREDTFHLAAFVFPFCDLR